MKHFIRENFFPIKNDVNIDYLINLLGENILSSSVLNNFKVIDISSLSITRDKSILFLEKEINIENIKSRDIHVISSSKENLNYYKSCLLYTSDAADE